MPAAAAAAAPLANTNNFKMFISRDYLKRSTSDTSPTISKVQCSLFMKYIEARLEMQSAAPVLPPPPPPLECRLLHQKPPKARLMSEICHLNRQENIIYVAMPHVARRRCCMHLGSYQIERSNVLIELAIGSIFEFRNWKRRSKFAANFIISASANQSSSARAQIAPATGTTTTSVAFGD